MWSGQSGRLPSVGPAVAAGHGRAQELRGPNAAGGVKAPGAPLSAQQPACGSPAWTLTLAVLSALALSADSDMPSCDHGTLIPPPPLSEFFGCQKGAKNQELL